MHFGAFLSRLSLRARQGLFGARNGCKATYGGGKLARMLQQQQQLRFERMRRESPCRDAEICLTAKAPRSCSKGRSQARKRLQKRMTRIFTTAWECFVRRRQPVSERREWVAAKGSSRIRLSPSASKRDACYNGPRLHAFHPANLSLLHCGYPLHVSLGLFRPSPSSKGHAPTWACKAGPSQRI